ncbi:MAG: hypothetical protein ACI4XJ_03580 [Eubacteriales bacterium]
MKIELRFPDFEHDININLPTSIVFSELSALIYSGSVKRKCGADGLPVEAIRKIFAVLREFKRKNPDFVLVEVITNGDEHVTVKL